MFDHLSVERDQLLANVENAQSEFKQNIEDYKSWFGFYQSAVRDFTLPEIILAAEKLVGKINFTQIQKKISSLQKHILQKVLKICMSLEKIFLH
ncbi:MAG: hypothetical protein OMM_11251 [Candidatus Magnetoglobus multicellularis str. Araruama]|uniref:Uncharacterized protein n=1 Tax=Candidatus Magnetoglobus multicellularis str. Araruama TaxID=890399 RepID=A0A1V1NYY2_9BACT|nr:MAG: hypothetical protein OMM_11251 [Candidatus Magnetoglobus multicellularis str. Araruama]